MLFRSLYIVKYLLSKGANIEASNEKEQTPLQIAVYQKQWEVVDFLMNGKADINSANKYGITILDIALNRANYKFVKKIMSNPNFDAKKHPKALAKAIVKDLDIAKKLIDKGSNLELKD